MGWLGPTMRCSLRTGRASTTTGQWVLGKSITKCYRPGDSASVLQYSELLAVIQITLILCHTEVSMSAKLEKLLEKEAQLKAQIQQAKAAEKTLERKRDTRRKILVGSAVLARVESGRWPKEDLLSMMDGFLTRENERDLFELDESGADRAETAIEAETVKQKAAVDGETETAGKKLGKARLQKADKLPSRKLPESNLDIEKEFNL